MIRRIVALGDSTSCGEGVGLRLPSGATWPARVLLWLGTHLQQVVVPALTAVVRPSPPG